MDQLPSIAATDRVLLVELGGTSYDVLVPMAASLPMRNLGRLIDSSALVRLRCDAPYNASALWATLETGVGPGVHGILDDYYFDHHRRRIVPSHGRRLPCPTLAESVTAADTQSPARRVIDTPPAAPIWREKPADFEQLADGIARTKAALRHAAGTAEEIDRTSDWRLLEVRFAVFDSLLRRLWNLLGVGEATGGNRQWVAKTREAFQTLDDCLGGLLELASRRGAAVVLVSPFGFGPFREKITATELLCRRNLLHTSTGVARIGYRLSRFRKKGTWRSLGAFRRAKVQPADRETSISPFSLLPVDWRRTRAVSLHGQSAALVYLNTPKRFGNRVLTTATQRRQAAADVVEALRDARHPATDEPLFADAYLAEERFGCDPFERRLPEVIGIPALGFQVRHRLDRNRKLIRRDASLAAVRSGEGLLVIHAPGVGTGQFHRADLADVAPMVLGMLRAVGVAGVRP